MAFTLLLLGILLFGIILAVIGSLLLFVRKDRLAGFVVLGLGILVTLSSVAGFLSLVIVTRTMG